MGTDAGSPRPATATGRDVERTSALLVPPKPGSAKRYAVTQRIVVSVTPTTCTPGCMTAHSRARRGPGVGSGVIGPPYGSFRRLARDDSPGSFQLPGGSRSGSRGQLEVDCPSAVRKSGTERPTDRLRFPEVQFDGASARHTVSRHFGPSAWRGEASGNQLNTARTYRDRYANSHDWTHRARRASPRKRSTRMSEMTFRCDSPAGSIIPCCT
jgi:hypothetical protein